MTRQEVLAYCYINYGIDPDFPFKNDSQTAVLRHPDNKKWFALLMKLPKKRLGMDGEEVVDVVNFKVPPEFFGMFGKNEGVYPAYHMNKERWVSVVLSEAPLEIALLLLEGSYAVTASKATKR